MNSVDETHYRYTMNACKSRVKSLFEPNPTCVRNKLLDRIWLSKLVSIVDTKFLPYMLAISASLWAFTIWQRRADSKHWLWWLSPTFAAIAILGYNSHWTLAWAINAFSLVWIRLPAITEWSSERSLPTFAKFISQLPEPEAAASGAPATGDDEASEEAELSEEPEFDCIVCWSSDETPKQLPCNHLICQNCLVSIKERHQHECPLCRRLLFSRNEAPVRTAYKVLAAIHSSDLSLRLLAIAIRTYKRELWSGESATDIFYLVSQTGLMYSGSVAIQHCGPDWWLQPIFSTSVRFGKQHSRALLYPMLWIGLTSFNAYSTWSHISDMDYRVQFRKGIS